MGVVITISALSATDTDGYSLVETYITGDTYSLKNLIRAAGYSWGDTLSGGGKAWSKLSRLIDIEADAEQIKADAKAFGATKINCHVTSAMIAKEKKCHEYVKKWEVQI